MNFCDPICHNFLLALQSHPDLPENPTSPTRPTKPHRAAFGWVYCLTSFFLMRSTQELRAHVCWMRRTSVGLVTA